MKKLLFALALVAATGTAFAQTTPAPVAAATAAPASYAEMMAATIAAIASTGDAAELGALASKMERAATVAPADWLPRYYQAYALTLNAFQSQENGDAKDKALDRAEATLAQARRLKGDESELLTLQALIYQARLRIAPMERGQQYAEQVEAAVAQAKRLNPANPRAYLVAANNVYYTPAEYGGGPAAARPLYDQAQAKFAAFRPASALAPGWGQRQLLDRLAQYAPAAGQAAR